MGTIKRYLFEDRTFDPDFDPNDESSFEFEEEHGDENIEDEEEDDDIPPPPTFSEEEVAAAQQSAFDEGKVAGLQEADAQIERMIATATTRIAEAIPQVFQTHSLTQEAHEAHALSIATTVAKKILPAYSENHGLDEIIHVVTRCLEPLRSEPRIIVKVHESLREDMQDRLIRIADEVGFDGRVVVMTHEDLVPGDCRVEWAEGGAERNSETLWQQIDEIIERNLTQSFVQSDPAEGPAPSEEAPRDNAPLGQDDDLTE